MDKLIRDSDVLKNIFADIEDLNTISKEEIIILTPYIKNHEYLFEFYEKGYTYSSWKLIELLNNFKYLCNNKVLDIMIIMKTLEVDIDPFFYRNKIHFHLKQDFNNIILESNLFLTANSYGLFDLVKFIYPRYTDFLNEGFVLAAKNGHTEIVSYLINKGANVNFNYDEAMELSCRNLHLNTSLLLFKKGANIKNRYSLILFSQNGMYNEVNYILGYNELIITNQINESFIMAAKNGHIEIVNLLFNKANIHVRDDEPLRLSSEYGNFEIVKLLINNGANIHVRDDEPLRLASEYGNFEIVKLLINNGANIHVRDDEPLRLASEKGHIEIVKLFLEAYQSNQSENLKGKSDK